MSMTSRTRRPILPSQLGAPRIVAIVLLTMMGIGLGVVRFMGEDGFETPTERLLASLAFEGLLIGPALLALMSVRRRAVLLIPAAIVLSPLWMLSFSGILLPLLLPAGLLWVAVATRYDELPCGALRGATAILLVLVLLVGAVAALLVHHDPRQYELAGGAGGGSTGDVVTVVESSLSIGLVALAVGLGWLIAAPRRRPPVARPIEGPRSPSSEPLPTRRPAGGPIDRSSRH
jgi:hypothetical protein